MVESVSPKMHEALTKFFYRVYEEGSIAGGILGAARPNDSAEWVESEDVRRSSENMATFVKEADEAIALMATRK